MSVEISNKDEYKNWSESIFVKIQHAQTITSFKINILKENTFFGVQVHPPQSSLKGGSLKVLIYN